MLLKRIAVLVLLVAVGFTGCSQHNNPTSPNALSQDENTMTTQVLRPSGVIYEAILGGQANVKPWYWFDAEDVSAFNATIVTNTNQRSANVTRVNGSNWGKVRTFPVSIAASVSNAAFRIYVPTHSDSVSWKIVIQEEGGAWRNWVLQDSTGETGYKDYDFNSILTQVRAGSNQFCIEVVVEGAVGQYIELEELYVFDKDAPPELIFWNKLGSLTELNNSEVGPDVIIDGNVGFTSGKYGNAFYSGPANNNFSTYFTNRIVTPVNSVQLNHDCGTVEAWVCYPISPLTVAYSHGMFGMLDGAYQNGPGRDQTLGSQVTNNLGDGITGTLNTMYVNINFGSPVQIQIPNANTYFEDHAYHHTAIVWDRNGIGGTSETIRYLIDGQVVGSSTNNNWGSTPDSNKRHTIGKGLSRTVPAYYIDNIKVYNGAKTDFSDRFVE